MRILISRHALLKIRQRRISKKLVIETVRSPDLMLPGRSGREELYKRFRTQNLKVVVVRDERVITVVTVHWIARLTNRQ